MMRAAWEGTPVRLENNQSMRIRSAIIATLMLGLVLAIQAPPVLAVPPLPSGFYGTVKLNGANAPVGALVSATIAGVPYAYATVQMYQGDTVYSLDIPGDDPATRGVIEGGVPGDTVVFLVNGSPARETAPWQSGTNVGHNLNLTSSHTAYLALIARAQNSRFVSGPGEMKTVTDRVHTRQSHPRTKHP